jgi:ActR/RegA family two-component response regulator
MKRDILLIEGDDRHRVALVRALLRQAYRVTLCSSLEEADEVLRYIDCAEAAPGMVLFGSGLGARAAARFERALAERFDDIKSIHLPRRYDAESFATTLAAAPLGKPMAAGDSEAAARALSVLLIEADREHRIAIEDNLRLRGDDVVGCSSVGEAAAVFNHLVAQGAPVDAVVSATETLDAEGLRFCATATSRRPDLRWIFLKQTASIGIPVTG